MWKNVRIALLLFVLVERRAANPMLPLALFRSRIFTLANVLTLAHALQQWVKRVPGCWRKSCGRIAIYIERH